jgi:hypothetical protein
MQVHLDDIGGGEPRLAKGAVTKSSETTPARVTPTGLFFFVALSRCDDHAGAQAFGPHGHFWAEVSAAHQLTLQSVAGTESFGRCVSRLDQRMIKHPVVFASGHEREPERLSEDGPGPALPIESQERAGLWKLIGSQIPSKGLAALAQLHAARARCHDSQNCRADFQRWAWPITVRVRTTCPRLRPV